MFKRREIEYKIGRVETEKLTELNLDITIDEGKNINIKQILPEILELKK